MMTNMPTDLETEREMGRVKRDMINFGKSLGMLSQYVDPLNKSLLNIKEDIYDTKKEISAREKEIKELAGKNSLTNEEKARLEELNQLQTEATEKLEDLKKEKTKEREELKDRNEKKRSENLSKVVSEALSKFTNSINQVMDKFLETQESMSYNLIGTGKTLESVTDKLNSAINGRGMVQQEKVYDQLRSLLTSGIVYNAEQRAYLAALSEDLGMGFQVQSLGLTRLINLQREDLTANRMAIQDSLKTFLNQNYQTSQYIKEGFQSVSEALIEAQSLMSTQNAINMEASVQKWMGSFTSAGMSSATVSSLASALGMLGSGNLQGLSGDKLQNLIILSASKSGEDYARLLTEGVKEEDVESLMGGLVTYLSEVAGRESNVVKSAFADLLGITVSDLRAITNIQQGMPTGVKLGTDISQLMANVDESVYVTTQLHNMLKNAEWAAGTNIASDQTQYMIYKGIEAISTTVGQILNGTTATLSFFGNGVELDLGKIASMVPQIVLTGMAMPSVFQAISNFSLGQGTAAKIFNDLDSTGGSKMILGAGNIVGLGTRSGRSTSGSVIISDSDKSDVAQEAKTSGSETAETMYTEEDESVTNKIYKLIGGDDAEYTIEVLLTDIRQQLEDLPNRTWQIATTADMATVSIGVGAEATYADDLLTYAALSYMKLASIQNILVALQNREENADVYYNKYESNYLSAIANKDTSNLFGNS